jgi:hypothetical protein
MVPIITFLNRYLITKNMKSNQAVQDIEFKRVCKLVRARMNDKLKIIAAMPMEDQYKLFKSMGLPFWDRDSAARKLALRELKSEGEL